ncbi:uncharacterized protein TNCV_1735041 [Trichonephila clavipes]|nr:uncharacterized protein TNCV_1735041 [Trichonephila clavipes]
MESFPIVRNKAELEARLFAFYQTRGQAPTDFIYDLLKIEKVLKLEMTEQNLIEHIVNRLEPQVLDYVEVRNSITRSQLLQVVSKLEDRYSARETHGPSNDNSERRNWGACRRLHNDRRNRNWRGAEAIERQNDRSDTNRSAYRNSGLSIGLQTGRPGFDARCHQIPSECTRSTCSLNQWVCSLVGLFTSAGTGEYFPPLQFTCRNCGGGDRGRVAIYRPFGEVSLSLNRTVTCMVLKANDRRTSCPCHDEFRGPRSDYVRQGIDTEYTIDDIKSELEITITQFLISNALPQKQNLDLNRSKQLKLPKLDAVFPKEFLLDLK